MSGRRSNQGQPRKGNGPSKNKPPAQGIQVKDLAPHRVGAPAEPRPVERTIRLTKRVQVSYDSSTEGTTNITPALIMQGVPGGTSFWSSVRFEKFEIYGPASLNLGKEARLEVLIQSQSSYSQPPFSLADAGTSGNRRPCVAFQLGLLDRARFFGVADTTVLAVVGVQDANAYLAGDVIVQATVELISPA
jgi:hypothetical protein